MHYIIGVDNLINDLMTAISTIGTSGSPAKHNVDPGWDVGIRITLQKAKAGVKTIFKD